MAAALHERASLQPVPPKRGTGPLPHDVTGHTVRLVKVAKARNGEDRRFALEAATLERRLWRRILILGCAPAMGSGLALGLFLFLPADLHRDQGTGGAPDRAVTASDPAPDAQMPVPHDLVPPLSWPLHELSSVREQPAEAGSGARPLRESHDASLELPRLLNVAPAAFTAAEPAPPPQPFPEQPPSTAQARPPPAPGLREMLADIRERLSRSATNEVRSGVGLPGPARRPAGGS